MSKRGGDFAEDWARENMYAGPYDPGDAVIEILVAQLRVAAEAEGISVDEMVEAVGDLDDFIAQALESATDDEVARLVAKDD